MVHCRLVSRVVVVGEKVEEVKGLVKPINGITLAGILKGGWNSHRDQQPLLSCLICFGFKCLSHLLNECGIVVLVLGPAASSGRKQITI